jgi:O-antigen ligase
VMLWAPSAARVVLLALSYVVGTAISVIYGVVAGSTADRNLGLTLHPNGLGYTCLYSVALLPFLLNARPSWRWPLRALALIALVGMWTSGSRGSVITLTLVLLVYIIVEGSATAIFFGWGLAAVLIFVRETVTSVGGNNVLARLLGGGSAEDATGQREVALHTALDQIREHPLLGSGFSALRAAHDIYLQIYAALGLLALIGLVLVLIGLATPVMRRNDPLRQVAYVAVAFVLLGPLSDSLSDTLAWAPLALCILVGRPNRTDPPATSTQHYRGGDATLADSLSPDRLK